MESGTLDFDGAEEARQQGLRLYRVKMADAGWCEVLAKSRIEAITKAEELLPDDCAITALPRDCGSGR